MLCELLGKKRNVKLITRNLCRTKKSINLVCSLESAQLLRSERESFELFDIEGGNSKSDHSTLSTPFRKKEGDKIHFMRIKQSIINTTADGREKMANRSNANK